MVPAAILVATSAIDNVQVYEWDADDEVASMTAEMAASMDAAADMAPSGMAGAMMTAAVFYIGGGASRIILNGFCADFGGSALNCQEEAQGRGCDCQCALDMHANSPFSFDVRLSGLRRVRRLHIQ
jgi:hypothetical protein